MKIQDLEAEHKSGKYPTLLSISAKTPPSEYTPKSETLLREKLTRGEKVALAKILKKVGARKEELLADFRECNSQCKNFLEFARDWAKQELV
jgi:hypothetical protein